MPYCGLFTPNELIEFGYKPRRKDKAAFELPPFVTPEHYRLLPLEIKVMYADKAQGVNGTEELIHVLRTPQ